MDYILKEANTMEKARRGSSILFSKNSYSDFSISYRISSYPSDCSHMMCSFRFILKKK